MATVIFGAAGAAIGSVFGNPLLGWSIGTVVGGLLFPPRHDPQERGRLDDLRVSGSAYGTFIPQCWGEVRLGGLVFWSTPLVEHVSSQDVGGSGSGGGGGQTVNSYSYSASFAVMVCAGEIGHVEKIWAEDLVIYDTSESPASQYNIAVYLGDESQTPDPTMEAYLLGLGAPCPAHRGYAYVVFTDMDFSPWGGRLPNMSFDVIMPVGTSGDVVESVMIQCGLDPSQYDLSNATEAVGGYLVAQRQSGKDAIEPMMRALAADIVEVDGQMRYTRRTGTPLFSLPPGDLGAAIWDGGQPQPEPTVDVKRQQERELPVSVEVTYFASSKQFQQAAQRAVRYTKNQLQDTMTVTVPMSMPDDDARRLAERLLYTAWMERLTGNVKTSIKWLAASPGDCLVLEVSGEDVVFRINTIEHEPFGLLSFSLVADNNLLLYQTITGADVSGGESTFLGPAAVVSYAWNGTALRDEDADDPGLYLAACGGPGWGGAIVYTSLDSGLSWQNTATIADFSPMGETLSDLADGTQSALIDTVNTVDVELTRGQLLSVGYWDLINGANVAIVGKEVIQFQTATLIGVNQYRLSNLLRGQRGSDQFWSHTAGDMFVLLTPAVVRVKLPVSSINSNVLAKFVPYNQSIGTVSPTTVDVQGYELWPYSGVDLAGTRDMPGNLSFEWLRRTRKGGGWADFVDVPLSEASESYEVDVMNGATIVRTIPLSAQLGTYSAANQAADFGSPQDPVTLRVYQVGQIGRGFMLEGSI